MVMLSLSFNVALEYSGNARFKHAENTFWPTKMANKDFPSIKRISVSLISDIKVLF